MSCIYFHSQDKTVHASGRERAMFGMLLGRIAAAALNVYDLPSHPDTIRTLLPKDSYLLTTPDFDRSFNTWFGIGDGDFVLPDGTAVDTFSVILNTALVLGSDVLRLMAKLHGQCEIHAFVEGPHRAWLADVMEQGLREKVLREKMGWDTVIALLRERDDGPVVTSYSVTDGFPNAHLAGIEDEAFWKRDPAERWRLALDVLLKDRGLEMSPDQLPATFAHNLTAFDLRQIANKAARSEE